MQAASLTAPATGTEAAPVALEHGNQLVFDTAREFAAPDGLFQMPGVESGTERFEVTIPPGLQLSLIDLATPELGTMSEAVVEARPARGTTGTFTISVNWSHPVPLGRVAFRLRVYASPDGRPPQVLAPMNEPGSHKRVRALFEQDAPVGVIAEGPLAKAFHDQIVARGGQVVPDAPGSVSQSLGLARSFDGGATIIITLAVIAAICVVIGLAVFAAVMFYAMDKGYDIEDAGYKTAVGEGASRQEHEMVFNIQKPGQ